jgi:hypothetical protein
MEQWDDGTMEQWNNGTMGQTALTGRCKEKGVQGNETWNSSAKNLP